MRHLSVIALSFGVAQVAVAAPIAPEAPGTTQTTTVDDVERWRTIRWGLLVTGAAAAGLGAGALWAGLADEDAIFEAERDDQGYVIGITQAEAARRQSDAESRQSLGAISLGIGGALIAAGITLWILEPEATPTAVEAPEPAPTIRPFSYRFSPQLTPTGALGGEVALRWSF